MDLVTPISQLTRVGKTTAGKFKRLGIITAVDLLHYFPFRYEDYRRIVPIKALCPGEAVTVAGTIELIANRRTHRRGKVITESLVHDDSGELRVVWFNQPFITKLLEPGNKVYLSGTVKEDMLGIQLVSPAYEKITERATTSTARLVPIYPLTSGLTQKQIRFLVQQVVPLSKTIPEWLPTEILEANDLVPLSDALLGIHFPSGEVELKNSTDRLKFDELFLVQLKAELSRRSRLDQSAPRLVFHQSEIKDFVSRLPFALTKTQKVAAWEILQDIEKTAPMNRLLSGDVGSGKTVVAALALYGAVLNDYQGVLMAPTEILATQHYTSLCKLFAGTAVSIAVLTANQAAKYQIASLRSGNTNIKYQINSKFQSPKKQKETMIEEINSGTIQIVVGTHALLSENIQFKKLGLVIVDEQHRFGVEQRKVIKEKSAFAPRGARADKEASASHFLSMTATPIPRSLALMLYGDLDVSIISELPPGRKKIITRLVEPAKREKAYEFIREQVKTGRQVFVVCPLIEGTKNKEQRTNENPHPYPPPIRGRTEEGVSDKKSVLSEYEKLSKKIFPDLRVGYLHGKMRPKEKDETMEKFKRGETDILVSTSVVEVGVDIPNASIMMIEGADRFGLAQLHQFRGRVGRSSHQSYCLLFTDSDSSRALERLRYFEAHHDGFKLAEKDLEMRGPGEVYGTEQSGMQELRLAKLTDRDIIKKAREAARQVAPDIYKYPKLAEKLQEWERAVHLE